MRVVKTLSIQALFFQAQLLQILALALFILNPLGPGSMALAQDTEQAQKKDRAQPPARVVILKISQEMVA